MGDDERLEVDVLEVMAAIRASIQAKRAQGVYSEDEVDTLTALRLRAYSEDVRIDPLLIEGLQGPGQEWDIAPDYPFLTTRTGPAAVLLLFAKRLVSPFVRLYTDHIVNRQAQLNLYLVRLLHRNIRETARLQLEMQALRHRCEVLEKERAAGSSSRG